MEIELIENETFPNIQPVRESMDIFISGIENECIPRRNGTIWVLSGSGGSGKSSLLLNFFKYKELYKEKFDNIYYICPAASFSSVEKHPFENHNKVYHELTSDFLNQLYTTLEGYKTNVVDNLEKKKQARSRRPKHYGFVCEEEKEDLPSEMDTELKYNCVIIDDMANELKNVDLQKALNKMLIKSRHINTMFIFTLQSYHYFPKILRKQITNLTLFKPKNTAEWFSVSDELFNLKKDEALTLYHFVFNEPYNHLDLDTTTNTFYKNFNKLIFKTN